MTPEPEGFPPGFFDRSDPTADAFFYAQPRLVTHIDDGAIAAVGRLYTELGLRGDVLDLMSSWVSHFEVAPESLTVLGMNAAELEANPQGSAVIVHDLNTEPLVPAPDGAYDVVTCCVSVDYLTRPIEVFADVARVLRPGGVFVCTFSNRLFPTKAIRGWLVADDAERCSIVERYFSATGRYEPATIDVRLPPTAMADPLYAVWARRA